MPTNVADSTRVTTRRYRWWMSSNATAPARTSALSMAWLAIGALWVASAAAVTPVPLPNVTQVALGEHHGCAVTAAGAVYCWGKDFAGQVGDGRGVERSDGAVDLPLLSSGVAKVVAGRVHSCALMQAGTVKCWGQNSAGQLGNLSNTQQNSPVDTVALGLPASALVAGSYHTCALLQDGSIKCWGGNSDGQLGDGTLVDRNQPVAVGSLGGTASLLAAGRAHTCALVGSNVRCWGGNARGQLGNASTTPSALPVTAAHTFSGANFIAAGEDRTCAIDAGGAFCWGDGSACAIGDSFCSDRSSPTAVTIAGAPLTRIATSFLHTCGLTNTGAVRCWGGNHYQQRGFDRGLEYVDTNVVTGLAAAATSVVVNREATCSVLADSRVQCWGQNADSQLGLGRPSLAEAPTPVAGNVLAITNIAAGGNATCATDASGAFACWGYGGQGQHGDGGFSGRQAPQARVTGHALVKAITSNVHACGVTSAGAVKCWGENFAGQLGSGNFANSSTPVAVQGLDSGVQALDVGFYFGCVIQDGAARCWGQNGSGQLGDNSTTDRNAPVGVSGMSAGVTALATGSDHACAVVSGQVRCWGDNSAGQLGDNSTQNRLVPVVVSTLPVSTIQAVSGGRRHTCALTTAGGVKCWGQNVNGQLGDGSYQDRLTPVDVVGLSGVVAVRTGDAHSCALTAAGAVKCWGADWWAQMGTGPLPRSSNVPIDVPGLQSGVSALSIGSAGTHTCVLQAGVAKCWGSDTNGQIGDGGPSPAVPAFVVLAPTEERQVATLTPAANAASIAPQTSADGRYVVFQSSASNLTGGADGNGASDVFRVDTASGATQRVSLDDDEGEIAGASIEPSVSADGQFVAFVAPTAVVNKLLREPKAARSKRLKGAGSMVVMRNLVTGSLQRVGGALPSGTGTLPTLAPDGRSLVYTAPVSNPAEGVPGQINVYRVPLLPDPVRPGEVLPGTARCVSCKVVSVSGVDTGEDADGESRNAVVSADGRYVAYETTAKNSLAGTTSPCPTGISQVVLRNMVTGAVQRVSPPATMPAINCGTNGSSNPSIDWSGDRLAFESDQMLTPGSGTQPEVFLADLVGTPSFERVSSPPGGGTGDGASFQPSISGDGETVAFVSDATDLDNGAVDFNGRGDVHARLRASRNARRLGLGTQGFQANGDSRAPRLNYNATRIVFDSDASNLVGGDANGTDDVFQRVLPAHADVVFNAGFE